MSTLGEPGRPRAHLVELPVKDAKVEQLHKELADIADGITVRDGVTYASMSTEPTEAKKRELVKRAKAHKAVKDG